MAFDEVSFDEVARFRWTFTKFDEVDFDEVS
jgi:hypothetical protein